MADMLEARCQVFPDKEVFAGTDSMTLTSLRAGGSGVISGISNIVPDVTTALYAGFEGDQGDAMQARPAIRRLTADEERAMRESLTAIGLTPARLAAE